MDELPACLITSKIASFYKPKFFECEEEHIDLVVITTDGELLEIYNKTIITSCKVCKIIKGYITIKQCYSYGPKIKYYIVLANETLFAIKKFGKSTLECIHLLDNIRQFFIEDKENLGFPQITALNVKEAIPPSQLNLSTFFSRSNLISSKLITPAVSKLYSYIHAMRMQIRKVEQLLIEKKSLVSRITEEYMFITNEDTPLDCHEELVIIFGEKSANHLKARNFPFSIGKLWIRACFDFWVIGVYVANLQNRKICNLELVVMNPDVCVERTQFYTNDERMEAFTLLTDYKKLDFIPCHGHGYVLGVLKEPIFKKSTLRFTCNLSFNFENQRSEQLHIGSIDISHTDILNRSRAAFYLNRQVPDLLSVFAASLRNDIKIVNFNEEVHSSLEMILFNFKFSKINEKYYFTDSKKMISFRGVLLRIEQMDDSCIITFYTRNLQELFIYVQLFKQLPSDLIEVNKASVSVKTITSYLAEEIKYFNATVKTPVLEKDSSGSVIIPLNIVTINEIISFEERTDYNFSLLK